MKLFPIIDSIEAGTPTTYIVRIRHDRLYISHTIETLLCDTTLIRTLPGSFPSFTKRPPQPPASHRTTPP